MRDGFYELYCEVVKENEKLKAENKRLKKRIQHLENRIKYLENNMEAIIQRKVDEAVAKVSATYEKKIAQLEKENVALRSMLNLDANNSGISTSKTPLHKDKRVPNSRKKSDRKIGGQLGHKKSSLKGFDDSEVTDTIHHAITTCSICGSQMIPCEEFATKDELDFEIVVKKKRHHFHTTECTNGNCKHQEKVNIPNHLKEENQYGVQVQALALSLMNQGCVSIARTKEIINGLTNQEMNLSEGYIAKLQKRIGKELQPFTKELKVNIINSKLVHWDDTVIMISTNRACLRFYGDEKLALYTTHTKKDKAGIDADGILLSLGEDTVVVHDHNIVNYNDDYTFQNAECCIHLLRDLQKITENLQHEWAGELKELLVKTNKIRKEGEYVDVGYTELQYEGCILKGESEHAEDRDRYYMDKEEAILKRLRKYKENYLMWVFNEEIPWTNNVSERALRMSKTKMKVSGQFQNVGSAENYARIRSYIETGKRHGMNPTVLLRLALAGHYATIEDMKKHETLVEE